MELLREGINEKGVRKLQVTSLSGPTEPEEDMLGGVNDMLNQRCWGNIQVELTVGDSKMLHTAHSQDGEPHLAVIYTEDGRQGREKTAGMRNLGVR